MTERIDRLEQAVDRLQQAVDRLAGAVDTFATNLLALRDHFGERFDRLDGAIADVRAEQITEDAWLARMVGIEAGIARIEARQGTDQ
jgi:hypothetical protein